MREPMKAAEFKGEFKGGLKEIRSLSAAHPHSLGSYAGNGERAKRPASEMGPRFTAEETILLRSLATGNTVKEIAGQLRLPRESLYRLLGDLRRKTGVADDTALAVWVLRNMGTSDRRGGER